MKFFNKYLFPPLYGLLIYFSIRLVNDTVGGFKVWERDWGINAIELGGSLMMGYLFVILINWNDKRFKQRPNNTFNSKQILNDFLSVLVQCLIVLNLTFTPMAAVTDNGLQWSDLVHVNLIPTLYILLYVGYKRTNYYLKSYVDSKIQLEKIQQDKLETELQFLKGQYHPHFLFNTLNTVYFQMDESLSEAKKTIEKLSDLLRYQLYEKQDHMIPIERELEYLHAYVEINKVRMPENFQLDEHYQVSTEFKLYPLLLIPLVENAFKHIDISNPLIHIEGTQENGHFKLGIKNTFAISQDQHGGIGTENLKRRLELLYGNEANLKLDSNGKYFYTQLKIPIHEN